MGSSKTLPMQHSDTRSFRNDTTTTRNTAKSGVSEKPVKDALQSERGVVRRRASSHKNAILPAETCLWSSMVQDSVEPGVYSHSTVPTGLGVRS